MPCLEIFESQSASYKDSVLPRHIRKAVIETTQGDLWYKWIGQDGVMIDMHSFGASAPGEKVAEHFGFSKDAIVKKNDGEFIIIGIVINNFDNSQQRTIVLFDGVCNSCNFFVNFILRYDRKNQFLFSSLQSSAAQSLIQNKSAFTESMNTIFVISEHSMFTSSTAIFKIFGLLGYPWNIMLIFSLLPKSLTDFVYNMIAKNRYRLFGKRQSCRIPSKK